MLHFVSPSYIQPFDDADFGDVLHLGHGNGVLIVYHINCKSLPLLPSLMFQEP
jgi:hypothetical protein